ncbi:MAG: hypothetical protein NVS1B4_02680 [Gemmatimonadaceae bacterium]
MTAPLVAFRVRRIPPAPLRYAAAVAAVAGALALMLMLRPYMMRATYVLFVGAVVVSVWFGGRGPGIVATLLAALAVDFFFFQPTNTLSVPSTADAVGLLGFGLLAALITQLTFIARRAWARAEGQAQLLQEQAVELEAQAEELAEQTRLAERARGDAESANRAKSDFLAVMSHELRTPLNAIIGYGELLADGITGPITDDQKTQLGRIRSSAGHLLSLIDEVLTISRVEARMEQVWVEKVSVERVIDEVAMMVMPLAGSKKLSLNVRYPDRPATIETDLGKLRQILVNLAGNAVKFTDEGEIALSAHEEGDTIAFDVRDTGIGIESDQLARIFEPFTQIESPTKRRSGGTGLGLSVARQLARLLGGDVTVRSTPGRGSTFTLKLPLVAPANRDSQTS